MGIKFRFAVLLTFFVSLLLIVSFSSIYLLYYNYREDEFYDRVEAEGQEFADIVNNFKDQKVADEVKILKGLHNNTLWDECLEVFDSTGVAINSLPDSFNYKIDQGFLLKIKRDIDQKVKYFIGDKQYVAFYKADTKNFVIASGYDLSGLKRLSNLRYILFAVFFGAILITVFVSLTFVTQLLKPLIKLSNQIQHINESKLTERVEVTEGNDEITQIGKNFNSLLERLNNAFESQKTFVHHASHELRTPLATMFAQTESALKKELSVADYKLLLLSLKEDQQEMIELTNSLLLLSQYEKLKTSKDWPAIRIDEVIYDSISFTKKIFPNAEILFSFENVPEHEGDIMLKGNETLLKSAFGNLIKNGYLYSTDKKITITVNYNFDSIFIHFDNFGNGITSTFEELITPFFRGENTAIIRGFGLGLSIVDRIMKLHEGLVSYCYIDNKINRFTIQLHKANFES